MGAGGAVKCATLGKVSGSGLGFPDNVAATLGKVLTSLELQQYSSLEFQLWLERVVLQLNSTRGVRAYALNSDLEHGRGMRGVHAML